MIDKIAYEDAREFQIAMEHERTARHEASTVLSLQSEAADAWDAFCAQKAGFFGRWMRRLMA